MSARIAQQSAAWAVHLFTASGAACGFLALEAIAQAQPRSAFAWMFVAVLIDALDGVLARAARVRTMTPGFDGVLLDNIVDYLNYAVVPAFFLHRFGLVPEGWSTVAAFMVLLAAAYQFSQVGAKTEDDFFLGFPSYWNVVVFYLFYLVLGPGPNLGLVATLALASFVPLKWAYPTRMRRFRGATLALALLWGGALALVLAGQPPSRLALYSSLLFVVYYAAVSLHLAGGSD